MAVATRYVHFWLCTLCNVIDAFVFQGGERGLKKAPEAELARRTYVNCAVYLVVD